MSELFKTTKRNILMLINSIYDDQELEKESTMKDLFIVQKEGNRTITRHVDYYNLDVILSVEYRIKSKDINNNTLTALTLLIAESNPKEKEIIIDLVMNFLNN